MSEFIVPLLMSAVVLVFYMVLVVALLRKYKSTGDVGFLWLGVAVVLWPFASNLLGWGGHVVMVHLARGHHAAKRAGNGVPGSVLIPELFMMIERIIAIGLLLVSVHYLAKGRESAEPDVVKAKAD